jgi:hypothetical protein
MDVWGTGGNTVKSFLTSALDVESGQLHVPSLGSLRKIPRYFLDRRLCLVQTRFNLGSEKDIPTSGNKAGSSTPHYWFIKEKHYLFKHLNLKLL